MKVGRGLEVKVCIPPELSSTEIAFEGKDRHGAAGEVESGTGEAEIRDASTISTRALDLLIQAAKVIVQYNVEDPSPEQLFMVSEHTRETPTGW